MDYPNDVISLRRTADIVEGYFSLSPEYRALIQRKIGIASATENTTQLDVIRIQYREHKDKIRAIRDVRTMYHNPLTNETMGLKEAKDLVESWPM